MELLDGWDPAGKGLTWTGMILGIIACAILALAVLAVAAERR